MTEAEIRGMSQRRLGEREERIFSLRSEGAWPCHLQSKHKPYTRDRVHFCCCKLPHLWQLLLQPQEVNTVYFHLYLESLSFSEYLSLYLYASLFNLRLAFPLSDLLPVWLAAFISPPLIPILCLPHNCQDTESAWDGAKRLGQTIEPCVFYSIFGSYVRNDINPYPHFLFYLFSVFYPVYN